jgi:hypothetical protein
LLFETAIAAVPITIIARLGTYVVVKTGWGLSLAQTSAQLSGIPFLGTGIMAITIGFIAPLLANLVTPTEAAKWIAIENSDNGWLRLLHFAVREEKPVALTLKNKKVYIGFVTRTPNLNPQEQYVSVLPLASGYRDAATLQLKLTADYASVYKTKKVKASDFAVTIPLSSIDTASFFNPAAYPLFAAKTSAATASPARSKPNITNP